MKTRIIFITALLLLGLTGLGSKNVSDQAEETEPVKICVTRGMEALAGSWIEEYQKTNPIQNFDLQSVSLAEVSSEIVGDNAFGLVIQQPDVDVLAESMWHVTLGREVIVAVVNAGNPYLEILNKQGVSPKMFADLMRQKNPTWNDVLKNNSMQPVQFIFENDSRLQLAVSRFLELDPGKMENINISEDVLAATQKNQYSIGFCRLSSIYDAGTQSLALNINLLPIDRNANGTIDHSENIYESPDQFERSVWIGKYPRSLVYNIYAVAPKQPENKEVIDFLSWVVTSGQTEVAENGYTELAYNEKQSGLEKLIPAPSLSGNLVIHSNRIRIFIMSVFILLIFGLLLTIIVHLQNRKRSRAPLLAKAGKYGILNQEILSFPKGLYFDKTHTWVYMGKKGFVKFGVDDFMPNVTGEYTRVMMKKPGDKVKRMDPVVTLIRKGKQIVINSPVSGTIREVNEALTVDPFMVNISPYEDGWVYEIEPSNWFREIRFFMLGEKYNEWIKSELNRLKDFLACSLNISNMKDGKLAFQEGGEIMINPLKDLDPKVWEDFQCHFINTSDLY